MTGNEPAKLRSASCLHTLVKSEAIYQTCSYRGVRF